DDFEIALLVGERDAPAHRILVLEVSPRQPLAYYCNQPGTRLIAVLNLASGQDWNLHRREETRSGGQDARVLDGNSADLHWPLDCLPSAAGVDDRGLRKRRAAHAGDRFEALAQVRVKGGDLRVVMPGLAGIQREQKDVLASVSQLDGVQLVECPDKQTGGDQDEKRDRDLGDHQNVLRAAALPAPAAIL